MKTGREILCTSTSESPPLTFIETVLPTVDHLLRGGPAQPTVEAAQRKLLETRREPTTMQRADFKAVR